jgi:hypothetical protein
MLPAGLIELIETHADGLTKEAPADSAGNPPTPPLSCRRPAAGPSG